jgi:lipoic acid synthetase
MALRYVVITSVIATICATAAHSTSSTAFAQYALLPRKLASRCSQPDFRGRAQKALDIFAAGLPDVMNHNLETVPRLYKQARPGADYRHSLGAVA